MALDPQAEWARLLLVSLADSGVRHVVVSPGSRSTPFLWAASAEPRLELHDAVDERAAGYYALGLARITGRPALLLSTSGTAVANYLPAVVEAGVGHVPLLVLTADRPVELAHCGANHTIDQL
jgi:2-succinyl-5-enolpyruvyl-6-hydroxy-3-cyclohexene-1-carboxylate synthase